jgi:hypothetical protein
MYAYLYMYACMRQSKNGYDRNKYVGIRNSSRSREHFNIESRLGVRYKEIMHRIAVVRNILYSVT